MSYFRHGDPLDDFDSLDRQESKVNYPICCHCGEPIEDRKLFDIEGNLYHTECARDEFLKRTRNYIED
jgi:RNA polymerase-binding transcription factor DksA